MEQIWWAVETVKLAGLPSIKGKQTLSCRWELKQRWLEFNSEADHLVKKNNNTVGDLVWNVLCLFVSGLNSLSELPEIVWVREQFWMTWPPSWGKRNPRSKKITFLNYSVHAWSRLVTPVNVVVSFCYIHDPTLSLLPFDLPQTCWTKRNTWHQLLGFPENYQHARGTW